MNFDVILKKPAKKFIKKLDKESQIRIINKLKSLKCNPSLGVPLGGRLAGLWKLRIGKYRVVYEIVKSKLVVYVLKVGHRKNVYG